ncbi:MAG: HEAT repeat domain-containing protein [Planctomycetota bacterium]|jgi:HEAT repeat protein/beta-lactamase regulating signal transducer with metallopeptidase domain/protocatechuate 3,4-dioxygenase beta subunit/Leucine-rich repeat (LRR) protein
MMRWIEMLVEVPPLVSMLAKITIILTFGWIVHLCPRRYNPRWRVLLWRGVITGVLLVPMLMPLKYLEVPVPRPSVPAVSAPIAFEPEVATVEPVIEIADIYPTRSVAELPPEHLSISVSSFSIVPWAKENIWLLLALGWALVAVLITLRFIAAFVRIRKKVRSSRPGPRHLEALLNRVAEDLNCRPKIGLRYSTVFTSPFLTGLTRPVVVLPRRMIDSKYADELPAIFAHEIAHLRSRDLWWMAAARWFGIFFWFHPLAWKLRDAHSTACEQVCDAVAADYVGNAQAYSGTLASIALRIVGRVPAVAGIPMARSSEILERLRLLQRKIYSLPLARHWMVSSLLAGLVCLLVLGGLRLVYAERSDDASANLKEGLVLYYSFNKDKDRKVTDLSGQGNHGRLSSGTYIADGKIGRAMYFNGDGDYIDIGDDSSIQSDVFTITAWIETSDTSLKFKDRPILSFADHSYVVSVRPDGGVLYEVSRQKVGGAGTTDVRTAQWVFVAVTRDSNNEGSIYVNGRLENTFTCDATSRFTYSGKIGGDYAHHEYFHGSIDEVRIYNRALSTSQIEDLYNTTNRPDTGAATAEDIRMDRDRPLGQINVTGTVHDEKGKAVSDALITLLPGGTSAKKQFRTDAEGRFSGHYSLQFGPRDIYIHSVYVLARHRQRNLAAAVRIPKSRDQKLEITLAEPVTLTGRISDPDGNPIRQASIHVWFGDGSRRTFFARNDAGTAPGEIAIDDKGSFEIKSVPHGCFYAMKVKAEGYGVKALEVGTWDTREKFIDLGRIVLAPANLSVSGVVVNENGKPVANADISLYGKGQAWSSEWSDIGTDANGNFRIRNLCPGTITIWAHVEKHGEQTGEQLGGIKQGKLDAQAGEEDVRIVVKDVVVRNPETPKPLIGKQLPDLQGININFNSDQAKDKRLLICFFRMGQGKEAGESRHCLMKLVHMAEELEKKDIRVLVVYDGSEGEQSLADLKSRIPFPVGIFEGEIEKVAFKWGLRGWWPRAILTDRDHTAISEGHGWQVIRGLDKKLKAAQGNPAVPAPALSPKGKDERPDDLAGRPGTRVIRLPEDRSMVISASSEISAEQVNLAEFLKGWTGQGTMHLRAAPATVAQRQEAGLPGTTIGTVVSTVRDGPARDAGLQTGDFIVRVAGIDVRSQYHLIALTRAMAPGTKVKVEFVRWGQNRTVDVVLDRLTWEDDYPILAGSVHLPNGQPATGAMVYGSVFYDREWIHIALPYLTDVRGRFISEFSGRAEPGRCFLLASTYDGYAGHAVVDFPIKAPIEIRLGKGKVTHGRLYTDKGEGLPDIFMEVGPITIPAIEGDFRAVCELRTDDNGAFVLPALPVGSKVALDFAVSGYVRPSKGPYDLSRLEEGLLFGVGGVPPGAVIEGVVIASETGEPLGPFSLTWRNESAKVSESIQVDFLGRFKADTLPAGQTTVYIDEYQMRDLRYMVTEKVLDLQPGQEVAGLRLMAEPFGVVTGRVTDRATNTGLAGFNVAACTDALLAGPFETTTDVDGTYRLAIPAGNIRFSLPENRSKQIRIAPGQTIDNVDFVAKAPSEQPTVDGSLVGKPGTRVIRFPEDRSMGIVYVGELRTTDPLWWQGWEEIGQAKGDVAVPTDKDVRLTVNTNGVENLSFLEPLGPDDIQALNFVYPLKRLDDNGLAHLAGLTGLRLLRLDGASIHGDGLRHLTKLKRLESLGLGYTEISDEALKYVSQIGSLVYLSLATTPVTDKGLAHLGKLSALQTITLEHTSITGTGFSYLAGLDWLTRLCLQGSGVTNEGLREIAKLKSLETLNLYGTKVTDRGIRCLEDLTRLRELDLTGTDDISDVSLEHIGKITSLEKLELPEGLTDAGLQNLTSLTKLKRLNISRMLYLGGGLEPLKNFKKLESLLLPQELTDEDLAFVGTLTSLQELPINNSPITNEGLAHLAGLKSLKKLWLHNGHISINMNVTVSGLDALKGVPLTYLHLWNIGLDDSRLESLGSFPELEELKLHQMPICDEDLAVVGKLSQLTRLTFTTDTVSDGGLEYLTGLTRLEDFQPITPLTDKGLYHIGKMKMKGRLVVKGHFTDEGLRHLEGLSSLRTLKVTTSGEISTEAKERLRKKLPNLSYCSIGRSREARQPPKVGQPAPAFALRTFDDKQIKLDDFRGKAVLLYFWATWCTPCKASTPALKQFYAGLKKRHGDRFVMLGLSQDSSETLARRYVEKEAVPWPQVCIGLHSQVAADYGVYGLPMYFVVGPDGKIVADDNAGNLEAVIDAALKAEVDSLEESAEAAGDMGKIQQLIQKLKVDDPDERAEAVRMLGDMGAEAVPAIPALIESLTDRGAIDGPNGRSFRAVTGSSLSLSADKPGWLAAEALGKIGAPAVEPLIEAIRKHFPAKEYIRAPHRTRKYGPGHDGLVGLDNAERALVKIGAPAVQPLINILSDDDRSVRIPAVWALGRIKDARAVEPLVAALKDKDKYVRTGVVFALGWIEDMRAVELLIGVLNEDQDWHVRRDAATALGRIGDKRALPYLTAALEEKDEPIGAVYSEGYEEDVRRSAASSLGWIGDSSAVEPLIKTLDDQDEGLRCRAAYALGQIGDFRATEALLKVLDDAKKHVRAAAKR